jgi:hypothetical protein
MRRYFPRRYRSESNLWLTETRSAMRECDSHCTAARLRGCASNALTGPNALSNFKLGLRSEFAHGCNEAATIFGIGDYVSAF